MKIETYKEALNGVPVGFDQNGNLLAVFTNNSASVSNKNTSVADKVFLIRQTNNMDAIIKPVSDIDNMLPFIGEDLQPFARKFAEKIKKIDEERASR